MSSSHRTESSGPRGQGERAGWRHRAALGRRTCDLVLPELVVFVRLLQGFDGRMVDLSKPLQHRCGQTRVREGASGGAHSRLLTTVDQGPSQAALALPSAEQGVSAPQQLPMY